VPIGTDQGAASSSGGHQNQLVMVMGVSDMLTAQGFSPHGKFVHEKARTVIVGL